MYVSCRTPIEARFHTRMGFFIKARPSVVLENHRTMWGFNPWSLRAILKAPPRYLQTHVVDNFPWLYDVWELACRLCGQSCQLNKVSEFLFNDLPNIGFTRIRPDRHSHGYSAPTKRTGRYADVSTAAPAIWHFANIVNGTGRRMQRDFQRKGFAIPGDTTPYVVDALNGVCEDRSPLRNVADFCENLVKPARLYNRFSGTRYGLGWHAYFR